MSILNFFYRWNEALERLGQEEVVIQQKKKHYRLRLREFIELQNGKCKLKAKVLDLAISRDALRDEVTEYQKVKSAPFGSIQRWFWRRFTDIEAKEKVWTYYENYDFFTDTMDRYEHKMEDIEKNFKAVDTSAALDMEIESNDNSRTFTRPVSESPVRAKSTIDKKTQTDQTAVNNTNFNSKENLSKSFQQKFTQWSKKYYRKEWEEIKKTYGSKNSSRLNWELRQRMLQREQKFQNVMMQWLRRIPEDQQGDIKNNLWSLFFKKDEEFQQSADPFRFYQNEFRKWVHCYKRDLLQFNELDHAKMPEEQLSKKLRDMASLRREDFDKTLNDWSLRVIKERRNEFQQIFRALFDIEEENFKNKIESMIAVQPLSLLEKFVFVCLKWHKRPEPVPKFVFEKKRRIDLKPEERNHLNKPSELSERNTALVVSQKKSLSGSSPYLIFTKQNVTENDYKETPPDQPEKAAKVLEELGKEMKANIERIVQEKLASAEDQLEEDLDLKTAKANLNALEEELKKKCLHFLSVVHPDKIARFEKTAKDQPDLNVESLKQEAESIFKELQNTKEEKLLELEKYQNNPEELSCYQFDQALAACDTKNFTWFDVMSVELTRLRRLNDFRFNLSEKIKLDIEQKQRERKIAQQQIQKYDEQIQLKKAQIAELEARDNYLAAELKNTQSIIQEKDKQIEDINKQLEKYNKKPEELGEKTQAKEANIKNLADSDANNSVHEIGDTPRGPGHI